MTICNKFNDATDSKGIMIITLHSLFDGPFSITTELPKLNFDTQSCGSRHTNGQQQR